MRQPNIYLYISKIDKYNKEELEEEYNKLTNLLNNIYQEYSDREETILFVSRQKDMVKERIDYYEAKADY